MNDCNDLYIVYIDNSYLHKNYFVALYSQIFFYIKICWKKNKNNKINI